MPTYDAAVLLDYLDNVAIKAAKLAENPPPGWTAAQLEAIAGDAGRQRERMYETASEDVQAEYDELQEQIEMLSV